MPEWVIYVGLTVSVLTGIKLILEIFHLIKQMFESNCCKKQNPRTRKPKD